MNKKRKTVNSPLLLGVVIGTIVCANGCFLFLVLFPPAARQLRGDIFSILAAAIFCLGLPIVAFFTGARRFFSVIRIDENGISRSLFGKFCKLSMTWDEIREVDYLESVMEFLLFSKTKSLQGMTYWQAADVKDMIQIQLTRKNYDCIKQYIKQPIIGLTDAKIKQLKLEK